MNAHPDQPLDWTLELLPSGNFTARRQEWLQPGALTFLGVGCLLALAAFICFVRKDYAATAGYLFGFVITLLGVAMTSIPQKSFSRRNALLVVEDRLWPRSNRRVQRIDASDVAEFLVVRFDPPRDERPVRRPQWNFGVQPGWEIHARLHGGATLRLFSELKDVREAAWLHWLGTRLLVEPPAGPGEAS
ncbi:MAG: hypothetical protein RL653_4094 [Pseudomonadota bacterium]|jgi:hypothetical protein